MESATGKICALNGVVATVEVEAPLACPRCAAGIGCGAGILQSAAQQSQFIDVRIPADLKVREGDSIELTIGPKFLLRAAILAYGLPLLGMVLLPGLAWLLLGNTSDIAGIVLAVAGVVAGLIIGRQILQSESICEQFVPAISRGPGVGAS